MEYLILDKFTKWKSFGSVGKAELATKTNKTFCFRFSARQFREIRQQDDIVDLVKGFFG